MNISAEEDSSVQNANILKTGMQGVQFKNWSETFSCSPEIFFAPKTVDEIKNILQLARQDKKHVRVVGSGHSPSDIACTEDFMISLQAFNKVVEVWREKCLVKVQAGILINKLNEVLFSHGLALSVLGSTSDITIGGAVSTSTHGTGGNYGTISSYITELELMTYDGNIIKCNSEENEDIFLAAACSLGCFGIILNVTLKCEPVFQLQQRLYGISLKDVIENLDVHISGSDHFRFMWFPYTDSVGVSHCTRTSLPSNKESHIRRLLRWIWDYGICYHALEFFYYISTFYPQIVPTINRCYFNLMFSTPSTQVDRSYRIFNFECLFKQYVNEWAIPKQNAGVALWQLREWIETNTDVYVHFPIEVRFCKADNLLISPAWSRDTCYINIIMYRPYGKSVPYENYWAAFEKIMMENEGRPHWAKAHSVTSDRLKIMYPYFGKWCSIRKQLDPINMFYNSYMGRIFQQLN